MCHYIFDNDENNIVICRKKLLLEKLLDIPKEVRVLLERRYNGLVEEIIKYLQNQDLSKEIDKECYEDAMMWWD